MTKTEQLAENYRQQFRGAGNHITSMDIKDAYRNGAECMIERLRNKLRDYVYDRYFEMHEDNIDDFCKELMEE